MGVVLIDEEQGYRASASRDARFDGQFILAVRTTGIYCRPSCPAIMPKRRNVVFFVHGGGRAAGRFPRVPAVPAGLGARVRRSGTCAPTWRAARCG